MKILQKIGNWTFGSIFRTFGRIIAYVIIGIIITLIISGKEFNIRNILGIEKVSAATSITPTSYKHKLIYKIYNGDSLQSTEDTGWFEGDKTGFCPSGRYCTLGYDYYYIILPSSLDAGRTYTLNFNTWVTTRPTANELKKITYWVTASNTGAYNGSSPANISAFNCRTGIEEGTTTKIAFSCSLTPSTGINYIYIRMNYYDIENSSVGYGPFTSYSCNKGSIVYDNSQTDAINQQTNIIQNQTDIINNNITDSTNQIINGLDGLEESMTENQKVCQFIDKGSVSIENAFLDNNGTLYTNQAYWGVTDYIKIDSKTEITPVVLFQYGSYCFYNVNKTLISCSSNSTLVVNQKVTIPDNTSFIRFSIKINNNAPQLNICKNGNQAIGDKIDSFFDYFKLENLKYLIIPTPEQMEDIFDDLHDAIASSLGILGLPLEIYTSIMELVLQETEDNWCLEWNAVSVPNFEEYNIIPAGSFCFNTILEKESINNMRNVALGITGALIILSFIQYLMNALHRVLDVPDRDNYEYITTEEVYGADPTTGEIQSYQIKNRKTHREKM